MKKLLLSLAIVMGVAVSSNAQEVGKMWVGGSVGIGSTKVDGLERSTSYKIIPEFGYVVSENLGIGVSLGYAHNEGTALEGATKTKTNEFTINPFVRYSFLKGDLGSLFVDGGVGYTYSKVKDGAKANSFEVGFRPGVAVNVSNRITLTGKFGFLGYDYSKVKDGAKADKFEFNLDMDNILLGMNIVF